METIALCTSKNSEYTEQLQKWGCNVIPFDHPLKKEAMLQIMKKGKLKAVVYEINDPEDSSIIALSSSNQRIIALCPQISHKIRQTLYKNGISECITGKNPERLSHYAALQIESKRTHEKGTILIHESNKEYRTILQTIITRFNHKPLFVETLDELFEATTDPTIQFTLCNIGSPAIDINELIRRAYSRIDIKRIPFLAYKDMNEGLFVHELIAGLNRLTRYILSPEELFSFLVELLYKKEIAPLLNRFNKATDHLDQPCFETNTLSQIFKLQGCQLFSQRSLIDEDSINELLKCNREIRKILLKTDGLKWMRIPEEKRPDLTCEAGVGN